MNYPVPHKHTCPFCGARLQCNDKDCIYAATVDLTCGAHTVGEMALVNALEPGLEWTVDWNEGDKNFNFATPKPRTKESIAARRRLRAMRKLMAYAPKSYEYRRQFCCL